MAVAEELEKLKALHAEGSLSNAEYEAAKARVLTGRERSTGTPAWVWIGLFVILAGGIAAAIWVFRPQESEAAQAFAAGSALVGGIIAGIKSQFEDLPMLPAIAIGLVVAAVATVVLVGGAMILMPVVLVIALPVVLWNLASGWFGG